MDLGFLLSVIGLLAGVWLFLHRTILDITVTSPTDRTLLFLGFMHCTVTNYLVLAFFIFFFKGTGGTSSAHIAAALPFVTAILLHTWPVVLICLVLGFLVARVSTSDAFLGFYLAVLAGAGFVTSIYQMIQAKNGHASPQIQPFYTLAFFGCILLLSLPYVILMGFFLADVKISTDKEFYKSDEPVIVSVIPAGYIFRAEILKVTLGLRQQSGRMGEQTLLIDPKEHCGDDVITVEFKPANFKLTRTAWRTIKMARTPGTV